MLITFQSTPVFSGMVFGKVSKVNRDCFEVTFYDDASQSHSVLTVHSGAFARHITLDSLIGLRLKQTSVNGRQAFETIGFIELRHGRFKWDKFEFTWCNDHCRSLAQR